MAKGTINERSTLAQKALPDRDAFLWDTVVQGFGLRVFKGSGRKSFVFQWKRDGRTRVLTLGTWPAVKAEAARTKAAVAMAAVIDGLDPAADRDEMRRSPTVAEVCERWLAQGTGPKGKPKRGSTLAMDRSRIDAHVIPTIGRKRIRSVTSADIRAAMRDIIDGKTSVDERTRIRGRRIVKGGLGVAARTLRMAKAIFAYAAREGLIKANPASSVHLSEEGERERDRYLSRTEMAALGRAMTAVEKTAAWQAIAAIKLILATGLRRNEALSLRWADIDFANRRLALDQTKTGRSVRPLSREAIAILKGIVAQSAGSPWVFPSSRGGKHYSGLQKAWVKIRAAAELEDVRLHDLRHTVGASAASAGLSLLVVGRMLGHRKGRSTERYAHIAPDVAADAADAVADVIALNIRKGSTG